LESIDIGIVIALIGVPNYEYWYSTQSRRKIISDYKASGGIPNIAKIFSKWSMSLEPYGLYTSE
jgi:hypothetical protein